MKTPESAPRTVGQNIRDLRKPRFATQRAFAKALGMEPTRVNELENDRYGRPSAPTLELVMRVLGCTMDDFFRGVPEARRRQGKNDATIDQREVSGHKSLVSGSTEPDQEKPAQKNSEETRNSVDAPRPGRYTPPSSPNSHDGQPGAQHDDKKPIGGAWKLPADFIALLGIAADADTETIKERGRDLLRSAAFLRAIGTRLVTGEVADAGEALPSSSPRAQRTRGRLSAVPKTKKARGV